MKAYTLILRCRMKKHIIDGLVFEDDTHKTAQESDFSVLDKLYEGRKAYYGDFHCHSNSPARKTHGDTLFIVGKIPLYHFGTLFFVERL